MTETAPLDTRIARVHGRVQGVGYRAWTCETARSLGITGWVRNEADGSVSALVHGPAARVAEFLVFLESGPRGARVTNVTTEPRQPPDSMSGFRIIW